MNNEDQQQKHAIGKLICLKCSYVWMQRTFNPPRRCPNCQTRRWNEPHQLAIQKEQPTEAAQ